MAPSAPPAPQAAAAADMAPPAPPPPAPFPLREALLAAGLCTVVGMFHFWKTKQTIPFKTCYALSWPTLGGAIMLSVTPSQEEMAHRLEHSKAVTPEDLRKQREANAATIEAMKQQFAPKQGGAA